MRNSLAHAAPKQRPAVIAMIKTTLGAPRAIQSSSTHHSKNGPCSSVSNQVDALAIPMVVKVTPLNGI
jgi:hypothetical protein